MRVKVLFKLNVVDDYPPVAAESVWATREGDTYIVDNIPWFAHEATLGDRIAVLASASGELWFRTVVARSGNSLLRAVPFRAEDAEPIATRLEKLGCAVETHAQRGMLAISVPAACDLLPVQQYLEAQFAQGVLDYEEPLLCHET